jgi:type IV fimbrial biogenesis protein FimT
MRQAGHTLLELAVTLAVIGILSVLAIPSFASLNSRVQIRCATEEIASELRFARQLAMTHRDRVRLSFDLAQHVLVAQFVDGGRTHHVYRYGDKGIVIEEPSAGPEILFHPSGRSATGTTIRLQGKDGRSVTLTVALTGRVSVL